MASSECNIRKILVANRGEIACRIFRTCRRLGIKTVAVYSEADAGALHVREADEAIPLEGSSSTDSYLSIPQICRAIVAGRADAVHPGYGFLSENHEFVSAVVEAGAIFVGPDVKAMRRLGDKVMSKRLAAEHKIPMAPSLELSGRYGQGAKESDRTAIFAAKVGFPILVKASAGGGGRGMREIAESSGIQDALDSASREAAASFGNPTIFLEKVIRPARHIEVQIAGDHFGNVIALGDRDCTWQRRNQKMLEEAPAPNLSAGVRKRMHEAACRLGRAAHYDNLGTVEFLLDKSENFYFLEVNSRLQVEHPVTELLTGLDLVELQIRIAEGKTLRACGVQKPKKGKFKHALEARLCAEVTSADGTPRLSTGMLTRLEFPHSKRSKAPGSVVRIDSGYESGSKVSHFYDSLIAKVIVGGTSRNAVIRTLKQVLSTARIEGISTNIATLQELLTHKAFLSATHAIDLFSRSPEISRSLITSRMRAGTAFAVAERFRSGALGANWSSLRSGMPVRSFSFPTVDGVSLQVEIAPDRNKTLVTASPVNSASRNEATESYQAQMHDVVLEPLASGSYIFAGAWSDTSGSTGLSFEISYDTATSGWVHGQQGTSRIEFRAEQVNTSRAGGSGDLIAPLPGRIVKIEGDTGNEVSAGDTVLVMESMKMEHSVRVTAAGKITEILVSVGDSVEAGSLLARVVYTHGR